MARRPAAERFNAPAFTDTPPADVLYRLTRLQWTRTPAGYKTGTRTRLPRVLRNEGGRGTVLAPVTVADAAFAIYAAAGEAVPCGLAFIVPGVGYEFVEQTWCRVVADIRPYIPDDTDGAWTIGPGPSPTARRLVTSWEAAVQVVFGPDAWFINAGRV